MTVAAHSRAFHKKQAHEHKRQKPADVNRTDVTRQCAFTQTDNCSRAVWVSQSVHACTHSFVGTLVPALLGMLLLQVETYKVVFFFVFFVGTHSNIFKTDTSRTFVNSKLKN